MIHSKTLSIFFSLAIFFLMAVEVSFAQTPLVYDGIDTIDRVNFSRVSEPGWYPYTIARPGDRELIRSTPMELRPYRPLHFYGNTIRRNYYRGVAIPMPRDIYQTIVMPLRRGN